MRSRLPLITVIGGLVIWSAVVSRSLAQDAEDIYQRSARVREELAKATIEHVASFGETARVPDHNMACLVCHANFSDEELVSKHLAQGITCAHCHGVSYEHMGDEANITPPDVMYGRAEERPFCNRCHGPHKDPAKVQEFQIKWDGHKRPSGQLLLPQAVCSDCHGAHYLHPEDVTEPE